MLWVVKEENHTKVLEGWTQGRQPVKMMVEKSWKAGTTERVPAGILVSTARPAPSLELFPLFPLPFAFQALKCPDSSFFFSSIKESSVLHVWEKSNGRRLLWLSQNTLHIPLTAHTSWPSKKSPLKEMVLLVLEITHLSGLWIRRCPPDCGSLSSP